MRLLGIWRYYIFWVEDSVNYQLGQTNPGNTAPRPFIYISLIMVMVMNKCPWKTLWHSDDDVIKSFILLALFISSLVASRPSEACVGKNMHLCTGSCAFFRYSPKPPIATAFVPGCINQLFNQKSLQPKSYIELNKPFPGKCQQRLIEDSL